MRLFQTGGWAVFPMGSRRSSGTRKFVKGKAIRRRSLCRGLRRSARSRKTRDMMITPGVIVPSHHTTVDADIHSLCDFWICGKGQSQQGSGPSKRRVGRRTRWNMLEGPVDIRRVRTKTLARKYEERCCTQLSLHGKLPQEV